MDALKPELTTLVKLGSLIVHYQEWTSPYGHPSDESAIRNLENDPQVIAWLEQMQKMTFIPLKRTV